MHFHTGTHVVAQLFGMSVNLDTIFTQWLTALIVFIIVFAASRDVRSFQTVSRTRWKWSLSRYAPSLKGIWDRIIKRLFISC